MISYIKGAIIHKTEQSIMISGGMIGYEVFLPVNRLLNYSVGEEREFYIYCHVREDALSLYGFDSWEERNFFLLLLNVSGVGPKGALAIIGESTLSGIYQAIAEENIAYLTKLSGIGKKTAQRLILELKDKLPQQSFASLAQPIVSESNDNHDDILAVLLSLGYHESEIRRIYPQLHDVMAAGDEQQIIKKALQLLAKI